MSLHNFPEPPPASHITIGEIRGQLITTQCPDALEIRKYTDQLISYPEVCITNDMLRPSASKESLKTAFLPSSETTWKKAVIAWNEQGFSRALEELVENRDHSVPSWMGYLSRFFLGVLRWTTSLHGSIFPHLLLTSEAMVDEVSSVLDWRRGKVRAFAWHPHITKFALAFHDDSVRIFTAGSHLTPILKNKAQKGIADLAWRPLSSSTLAVSCFSCVIVWHIDPVSVVTRPSSSSCAQMVIQKGHGPVTSVCWSPCGKLLLTASPCDTSMMVWDVSMEVSVPLKRVEGGGVSFVRWSPDGRKVFSATPSPVFRVWETQSWTCDRWSTLNGRCQAACWSPDSSVLLFAVKGEPYIYALMFNPQLGDTNDRVGGSKAALPVINLTPVMFETRKESLRIGGCVQSMVWDSNGERLAVTFMESDSQEVIAVFRTRVKPTLGIFPCGFIRGAPGEFPQFIVFQDRFEGGALLTVCWSSGNVVHIPFLFLPVHGTVVSSSSTLPTIMTPSKKIPASLYSTNEY